jgi:hypothetical protein
MTVNEESGSAYEPKKTNVDTTGTMYGGTKPFLDLNQGYSYILNYTGLARYTINQSQ